MPILAVLISGEADGSEYTECSICVPEE
jgi:hypothetical protein